MRNLHFDFVKFLQLTGGHQNNYEEVNHLEANMEWKQKCSLDRETSLIVYKLYGASFKYIIFPSSWTDEHRIIDQIDRPTPNHTCGFFQNFAQCWECKNHIQSNGITLKTVGWKRPSMPLKPRIAKSRESNCIQRLKRWIQGLIFKHKA